VVSPSFFSSGALQTDVVSGVPGATPQLLNDSEDSVEDVNAQLDKLCVVSPGLSHTDGGCCH
jgi:hypothetical protein